jgi:hypothetical protein
MHNHMHALGYKGGLVMPENHIIVPTLTESTQGFHRLGTHQPGLDDIALLSI